MTIAAFGEVMLRLTVPDHLLLEQTDQLQMSFTGTGVNILASLAHFGQDTRLISAVPANRLGSAAQGALRRIGVGDRFVQQRGDHLGSFFVELGYGNRPDSVTYQNRGGLSRDRGAAGCGCAAYLRHLLEPDCRHS